MKGWFNTVPIESTLVWIRDWIAAEHHRLHIVEEWTQGPRKQAAFFAIESSLLGLARCLPPLFELARCPTCGYQMHLFPPSSGAEMLGRRAA
jgi:hypothetical protein